MTSPIYLPSSLSISPPLHDITPTSLQSSVHDITPYNTPDLCPWHHPYIILALSMTSPIYLPSSLSITPPFHDIKVQGSMCLLANTMQKTCLTKTQYRIKTKHTNTKRHKTTQLKSTLKQIHPLIVIQIYTWRPMFFLFFFLELCIILYIPR